MIFNIFNRGGVEDTRLEAKAKAKDTKKSEAKDKDSPSEDRPSRGQGQECSRPRTQAQVFSKKWSSKQFFRQSPEKKGLQKFFPVICKKKVFKNFFQAISNWENPKRSSQIFREVSGVFQQNFNGSKNSGVLELNTGQFSRTWGFEAKSKDFKMCPRGLHLWYLNNRSYFVKSAGCAPQTVDVKSGVPQSSILGPVLFNLYFKVLN